MGKWLHNRYVLITGLSVLFQGLFVVAQYTVGQGHVYGWVENGMRALLLVVLFRKVTLSQITQRRDRMAALALALLFSLIRLRYDSLRYGLEGWSLAWPVIFFKDVIVYFLLLKAALSYLGSGAFPAPEAPPGGKGLGAHPAFFCVFVLMLIGLCLQWRAFYFPTRTSPDTINQWNQIHGLGEYHDMHAIGHTLFLKALILVFDHPGFLVLVQLLMMAGLAGVFADFLHRRGTPIGVLAMLFTLYQCLLPASFYMYPWKDIPYAFCVGLTTYWIMRCQEADFRFSLPQALVLGAGLAWMALFRQNGLVPLILCGIYFTAYFVRRRQWTRLALSGAAVGLCFLLVWAVAYRVLRVESPLNGYPYQVFGSGIAAVVAGEGNISPALHASIEALLPVEFMQQAYTPWETRTLIWGSETVADIGFHTYLAQSPGELIRIYLALIPGNLGLLLRDVMYNTFEVWGYMYLFSNATLLFGLLVAGIGCRRGRRLGRRWVVLLPVLANVLSIAISTITNEMRYLLPTYTLYVPLLCYVLYGGGREGRSSKEQDSFAVLNG